MTITSVKRRVKRLWLRLFNKVVGRNQNGLTSIDIANALDGVYEKWSREILSRPSGNGSPELTVRMTPMGLFVMSPSIGDQKVTHENN